MKYHDHIVLLLSHGLDLDDGYGWHNGRPVRYLEHRGVFQVGDEDFDRWANSVDMEFDMYSASEQRRLEKWLKGE